MNLGKILSLVRESSHKKMVSKIKTPNGFMKVDKPEHPFTYDGPDVLLSDKSGLLALFEIRRNEHRNPSSFFARVTNSIIAYPSYTQMLVLVDKDTKVPNAINQYSKLYLKDFLTVEDLKKAKLLLREKKQERITKEIKGLQRKIFDFQSVNQSDNIKYFAEKVRFSDRSMNINQRILKKSTYYNRLSQRNIVVRANIFNYKNLIYGQKKFFKGGANLDELKPFFEFAINTEFDVDNGVPYFSKLSNKVLNLNLIPLSKVDPLKPTRIASLFGWHIVNTPRLNDIEARIAELKTL